MLKVEKLSKVFYDRHGEEIHAVKDLSFECQTNEIVAVLGMNGAGKSTTLRMLSTVISPSAGSASLDDLELFDDPQKARHKIGILTGSTGLYKKITARETLDFFGQVNDIPKEKRKAKIEELVKLLDMAEIIDRKCEKLSTGQKQKVNIARTILHEPSLLILDEATTGLDVVSTQSVLRFIKESKSPERSILFCTHRMDEVYELCDRVLILHQGEKIAWGTIEEICQQFEVDHLSQIFQRIEAGTAELQLGKDEGKI